jgi:hypothetical protein
MAVPNARPRGVWLIAATAFVGCLYFLGINLGYLTFAGALPELRLRYFLSGIFAATALMRVLSAFAFRIYPTRLASLMYGLLAVVITIQALWYFPITNAGGTELYFSTIGDSIVASSILAITGESLGILWLRLRLRMVKVFVAGAAAIIISTIALGVGLGWNLTAEMRLLFSGIGEVSYNYLSMGDSLALLGLMLIGLMKHTTTRILALIFLAVALFFAHSRTSFFLFLVSSPFILFVGGRHTEKIGVAAVIAIAVAVFLAIASESDAIGPGIERMTVLLFQREADESFVARRTFLVEGLGYLRENWLLGRFLDEWWRNGVGGGYMHNWLSFWQSYGLFPFLGTMVLFSATGFVLWKQLLKPTASTGTAIAIWMYAVLAVSTARGYTWPYVWLAFGVVTVLGYARANDTRRTAPAISNSEPTNETTA